MSGVSLLLYGIFLPRGGMAFPSLSGVAGRPLFTVTGRGLAAAVSESAGPEPAPGLSSLLAYEKAVAALHRSPATDGVIPMRYGSLLVGRAQVRRMLDERGEEYKAVLREVAGCEEMGIRLLLPVSSGGEGRAGTGGGKEAENGHGRHPSGKAYLEALRARYAEREALTGESGRLVERCSAALAEVSRRLRTECRTVRDPRTGQLQLLVSLYFLVPRSGLPDFRRKVGEIGPSLPPRLLLSGPWPPFNFVLPETKPHAALSATGNPG